MLKAFEKHKLLRNLTCFLIVLKHIQVDRRIILAFISDKLSSLACHNNCQNFVIVLSVVFKICKHLVNDSGSTFLRNPLHTC